MLWVFFPLVDLLGFFALFWFGLDLVLILDSVSPDLSDYLILNQI